MSRGVGAGIAQARGSARPKLKDWLEYGRHRLYAYRPRLQNWHFWMVQGLVIAIAIAHNVFEARGLLHEIGMLYFIPISMFLIPVLYAALTFGFAGSLATALWATVITIPNFFFAHQGPDRLWEIFQMVIVVVVAFFVGQQVDRQRNARQQAEAAAIDLKASRMKYRSLFESSPLAILVLDRTGVVLEANPAASILFGGNRATLAGRHMADLIGTADAQKLLNSSHGGRWQADSLVLKPQDGLQLYLEPLLTEVSDGEGNLAIQALFRDVTRERSRQAGLRAYAAHVIRAQEEERQRIARELHDETIQSVVLLCRQLDSVESTGDALSTSAVAGIKEARRTAEEVVRGLRGFAAALRPPILDDLGIMTSIRRLLVDFTERSRVEGKFKIVGKEHQLPADTKLGMFRIAQEALWNVERHAKATRVVVTIAFVEGEVRLDVLDNGLGFTVAPGTGELTTNAQLGLIGMMERAELLGGNLEVQSNPGKGTRITVSIPVAKGNPEVPSDRLDL